MLVAERSKLFLRKVAVYVVVAVVYRLMVLCESKVVGERIILQIV